MNLIFVRTLHIVTDLSAEEIIDRLHMSSQDERFQHKKLYKNRTTFRLFPVLEPYVFRNSFNPVIIGKISKQRPGEIRFFIRPILFFLFFSIIWVSAAIFGMTGIFLQSFENKDYIGAFVFTPIVTCIFLGGFYLIYYIGFIRVAEKNIIFLRKILKDKANIN